MSHSATHFFLDHKIIVLVTGKRFNRWVGNGFGILAEYTFSEKGKFIQWAKKELDKIDKNVEDMISVMTLPCHYVSLGVVILQYEIYFNNIYDSRLN